jgi:hypothetical protein
MADDFTADTNTTGRINVNAINTPFGGEYVTGNIEVAGDHDWFRVWLWANTTYVVREIDGSNTPYSGLTLDDAVVALHDSNGATVASNDDGGLSRDSYLEFVTSHSGYYYVDAAGFNTDTGTYYVSVTQAPDAMGKENLWGTGVSDAARFGDFNGDGHSDMITIDPSGAGNINVAISAENGFNNGFTLWGNGGVPTDQIGHVNTDARAMICLRSSTGKPGSRWRMAVARPSVRTRSGSRPACCPMRCWSTSTVTERATSTSLTPAGTALWRSGMAPRRLPPSPRC